ncbi:hypothetical protein DFJ73DRAFT_797457 [Zopfochytrium polystomum]|nr:hypothetical protein DFJ73DRAFT_797457 [Zopfochytrium polystomum]
MISNAAPWARAMVLADESSCNAALAGYGPSSSHDQLAKLENYIRDVFNDHSDEFPDINEELLDETIKQLMHALRRARADPASLPSKSIRRLLWAAVKDVDPFHSCRRIIDLCFPENVGILAGSTGGAFGSARMTEGRRPGANRDPFVTASAPASVGHPARASIDVLQSGKHRGGALVDDETEKPTDHMFKRDNLGTRAIHAQSLRIKSSPCLSDDSSMNREISPTRSESPTIWTEASEEPWSGDDEGQPTEEIHSVVQLTPSCREIIREYSF